MKKDYITVKGLIGNLVRAIDEGNIHLDDVVFDTYVIGETEEREVCHHGATETILLHPGALSIEIGKPGDSESTLMYIFTNTKEEETEE